MAGERGGLRPAPPGLPWRGATTTAGLLLAAIAVLRALPALAERPTLRLRGAAESAEGGRPALLYLFQREDCRRHVALQRRWAALGEAGAVTVVGVSLDETEAPHEGAGAPGPGFPVRTDLRKQAGRLMGKLGYETTPVTVLVDRRGRPRLVLPPPADEVAVEAQARAVRAALGAL